MGFTCTEYKYSMKFDLIIEKDPKLAHYLTSFVSKGCRTYEIPAQYTRDTSYRRTFFSKNKPVMGRYRCAYCGRKIPAKKITVDHLIPVHAAEHSLWARRRLRRMGCRSVNDAKNLVPACRKCNQRKGGKTGIWIIRGKLGQKAWYWPVRRLCKILAVFLFLYILYYLIFLSDGNSGQSFIRAVNTITGMIQKNPVQK